MCMQVSRHPSTRQRFCPQLERNVVTPVESIEDYLARMAQQDEQTDCATHDSDDDSPPQTPPAE